MILRCNSFKNSCHIFIVAILISVSCVGSAQAQHREKVKERVDILRKTRLADVLFLNEQDAPKFFAKYDLLQKKVREAREGLRSAISELENSVQKKSGNLSQKSEVVFEKQTAYNNAMIEKIRGLKPILTEEQYAKLVVFEHNFPLQLQKILMKHAKKQEEAANDE